MIEIEMLSYERWVTDGYAFDYKAIDARTIDAIQQQLYAQMMGWTDA